VEAGKLAEGQENIVRKLHCMITRPLVFTNSQSGYRISDEMDLDLNKYGNFMYVPSFSTLALFRI